MNQVLRSMPLVLLGWLVLTVPALPQNIEVTLLGTGTPEPSMVRFGAGTLIQAGDQTLLFDVGRGAMQRLGQLQVSYEDIDALFLTHLHSDHVVGIPDLWLTGWLISGRDRPLQVFGPPGTAELISNLTEAFAFDIGIRVSDDEVPIEGSELEVEELQDGEVYENGGVRVLAFDVDHRPVSPALGYRIEFAGKAVLLSGDTRYSENLINNAAGVDLLIHEVAGATPEVLELPGYRRAFEHHTTAEEAGEIFTVIAPKLAVYSHLVLFGGYTVEQLVSETRRSYSGPLVVGEDLMSFQVGDEVSIFLRH